MQRRNITGLVFAILSVISFSPKAQAILSKDQIGTTLTHFYSHPDSGTLKLLINSIQNSQEAREALPSAPIVGFFSAILLSDSPNEKIVKRELSAMHNRFELFDYALLFGKSQDTIFNWTNRKPDSNDLIWGAYFGTGDTRYLDKLLGETVLIEREDSLVLYMTGASAKWSLASNARQHESIKKHLSRKELTADDKTKKMLWEILTKEPGEMRNDIMKRANEIKSKTNR